MTVWPKFSKLDSSPRCDQECFFLLWLINGEYIYIEVSAAYSECEMPGQVGEGFRNDSGLYVGALNHTNELLSSLRFEIPTSHLIANPRVHPNHTVFFLSLPYQCLLPCV